MTTAQLVWILAERLPELDGVARTDESEFLNRVVRPPSGRTVTD